MRIIYGGSLLLFAAILLSGCTDDYKAGAAEWAGYAAETSSRVIAVDISEQGVVKVMGLPQAATALSAAESPRVVLLGTDFVRRHGIILGGGKLPQQPELVGEPQPIVAVAEGAAAAFMGQASALQWLPQLQRIESGLDGFKHRRDGRKRDTVVPYLRAANVDRNEAIGVQVRAAVLRGREPARFLNEEELELLACLDGQAGISERQSISCRTQWSSNGDLKAPRINALVTVTVRPNDQMMQEREASETIMARSMTELLQSLQLQGTDPLDIGQTVRSLYRGIWTQERWRTAFSRADIGVQVRLTS